MSQSEIVTKCYHCGSDCVTEDILFEDKDFCCHGCLMVYQLLRDNGMDSYYLIENNPGIAQDKNKNIDLSYLDNEEIVNQLLIFKEGNRAKMIFNLPQIHCSSCLWLLERINHFDPGITNSRVNFHSKELSIVYDTEITNLKNIVSLLHKIGYAPELNLGKLSSDTKRKDPDRQILYKLGVAGFTFGNIMLLSFPEYLGFEKAAQEMHLGYINFILALPVVFYAGWDYFKSAWKSIRALTFNLDVPIALGMATLFLRSCYEVFSGTGEGYFDSLAGFVFFLLIGKWFQNYTYKSLDFERSYTSYFPISTLLNVNGEWVSYSVSEIKAGDEIMIRNEEIIPTDAILLEGDAMIDYSFVTGESDPVRKVKGEKIYAGGKQIGNSIKATVLQAIDQAYLTKLWNESNYIYKTENKTSVIDYVSRYFTFAIVTIATLVLIYWLNVNPKLAFNAFTAVLIVACPCALALAIPFTYGNVLRLLSSRGFFIKSTETIEQIQDIDSIIIDKTGTITDNKNLSISYNGEVLTTLQSQMVKSLCFQSTHPKVKAIYSYLPKSKILDVSNFQEVTGQGMNAIVNGHHLIMGSPKFLDIVPEKGLESAIYLKIDNNIIGSYLVNSEPRKGIEPLFETWKNRYKITLLSGDNNKEESKMRELLGEEAELKFNQTPYDKLDFVKKEISENHHPLMIGDGLNDAGALKQSSVGIVVTGESNNFTPASDAIIAEEKLIYLHKYIGFIKASKWVIYTTFLIAFLYNSLGLYFAATAKLTPIIAAILMPLSSLTVVIVGVTVTQVLARQMLKES